MKKDRELIKLARENPNVESLAKKLETISSQIIKASRRLGISLGLQSPKPDGKFKSNVK